MKEFFWPQYLVEPQHTEGQIEDGRGQKQTHVCCLNE